jgi:hypothetical protein
MLRRIIAVDGKEYKIVIFIPYKKNQQRMPVFYNLRIILE